MNNTDTKPGLIFKVTGFALYIFGIVSLFIMISRAKKYGELSFSVLHEQSVMLVFILGAIFHGIGSIIGAIHTASKNLAQKQSENADAITNGTDNGEKTTNQLNYPVIAVVILVVLTILIVVLGKAT